MPCCGKARQGGGAMLSGRAVVYVVTNGTDDYKEFDEIGKARLALSGMDGDGWRVEIRQVSREQPEG